MKRQQKAPDLAEEQRTTATGLARYAYDYIDAARVVNERDKERHPRNPISPMPAYFLASHGIELTLKAYLLHKGATVSELSGKFGHDLHACYRKSKELGLLDIFEEQLDDDQTISLLVKANRNQELRYIQTGAKQFPWWSHVDAVAVRLHQAVAPLLGLHTFVSCLAEPLSRGRRLCP